MWHSNDGEARPRLMAVIGTRPEAIKVHPLAAACDEADLALRIVATGQHGAMLQDSMASIGGRIDHDLGLGPSRDDIDGQRERIRAAVRALVKHHRPDMLLVQGDTTSALGAALGAADAGVPVGHVEAGLRSHDLARPWPEEGNRIAIDALSTLLFAPSDHAAANLAREPAVQGEIIVTGNTGIDALLSSRDRLRADPDLAPLDPRLDRAGRRLILVTCHRRESIGPGLEGICDALELLAARPDVLIGLPLHPNPAVRSTVLRRLAGHPNVILTEPLDYLRMIRAMERAHLILTDSGGLQEEAPALGRPALVLRDVTERPEAVATGSLRLVGTDPHRIMAEASRLLDDPDAHAAMARPAFPYGQGDAARRIAYAIARHFGVSATPAILPLDPPKAEPSLLSGGL